MSLNLISLNS